MKKIILGQIIPVRVEVMPGFQFAMIAQRHQGDIYRCRLLWEGEPYFFNLTAAEILEAGPRPAEDFKVMEALEPSAEDKIASRKKRQQGKGIFPYRKDSGQVN
jgi:hypothetical protein